MAYNGVGVFARLYNWVADAAAGIKIKSDRMDAEMDGLVTGLTNAICKDGQSVCSARIPFAVGISTLDGSAGDPGINFTSDPDNGFYRISANNWALVVGGAKVIEFSIASTIFYVGGVEYMRQTAGHLMVGAVAQISAEAITAIAGASAEGAILNNVTATFETLGLWNSATAGDNIFARFYTEGTPTTRGLIDYNRAGGAVRYLTTSDEAFKTKIADAKPEVKASLAKAAADIASILSEYEMADAPGVLVTHGLVAQRLHAAYPDAVAPGGERGVVREIVDEETGEKRIESHTETVPWMYDRSMLVFPLLATSEAQAAKIVAQAAQIASLESRLSALEGK